MPSDLGLAYVLIVENRLSPYFHIFPDFLFNFLGTSILNS